MDIEKKKKENDKVALRSRIIIVFLCTLFVLSVLHSSIMLYMSNENTYNVRVNFVIIAFFLSPIYWLIYIITYFKGGFK